MPKILIVDDVQTQQEMMRATVADLGHTCVFANDGEQALNMAKSEKPNLVLLDVVMPRVDGFQVCRRIKKDPETAHIPIILVSSKSEESDKFWGIKQGASDYIAKPFQPETLTAAVK